MYVEALAKSSMQLNTSYAQDGERTSDYQHLDPVIKRLKPHQWVFPKRRIIYEPCNGGIRYNYHPGQYEPAEIILRLPDRAKPLKCILEHSRREPIYESVGNQNTSYIHVLNLSHMGPDDEYAVFDYFLKSDVHREHSIKVFYKKHDEYLKLLAVSVPLELLGSVLGDKDGSYDDGD